MTFGTSSGSSSGWSTSVDAQSSKRGTGSILPVLEIDGERAFTYFVDEDALRHRLDM